MVGGVRNIILNLSCLPLQTRLARQAFVVARRFDFVNIDVTSLSGRENDNQFIAVSLWFLICLVSSYLASPALLSSCLALSSRILSCLVVSFLVCIFCLCVCRCPYFSFLFCWSCVGAADSVSSGRQCVPAVDVDGDLFKCAEHCHNAFSSGKDKTLLASATIDPIFAECCCYSEADCACKGQVASRPLPANVMMLPGFTLPEEVCPTSRVEGGWVRDCEVCVQRVTPTILNFGLVWHDLSLSNRTQFCRRMPPVSILQQTESAALLRLLGQFAWCSLLLAWHVCFVLTLVLFLVWFLALFLVWLVLVLCLFCPDAWTILVGAVNDHVTPFSLRTLFYFCLASTLTQHLLG
jgi:hypothetical protein